MRHGIVEAVATLFGGRDEDLMVRVQDTGDPRAFAALLARWEKPIRNLCIRMTGDAHRGEDLKQETFARLFAKRATYRPTGRFSTYLWRIALNICHDDLRRLHRRLALLTPVEPEAGDDPLDGCPAPESTPDLQAAQTEEGELVRAALLQLPEIYRTVLVLRHYEHMKLSEIAETLEVPLGTVNSRMAEALARLSRLLEPQFSCPESKPAGEPEPTRSDDSTPGTVSCFQPALVVRSTMAFNSNSKSAL
jgi:RNA polymerase sigma-70 factor (ECF subfamily)